MKQIIYQRPAHSIALKVSAERLVTLLILASFEDTLDKGLQLRRQQGIGPFHVTQNPNTVTGARLRNQQY